MDAHGQTRSDKVDVQGRTRWDEVIVQGRTRWDEVVVQGLAALDKVDAQTWTVSCDVETNKDLGFSFTLSNDGC